MNAQTQPELLEKISGLEKKIEHLQQLNENNKAWIALLAHDFRGVFGNLIWILDLYKEKTLPLESFVELIPELEQNAQKNLAALDDTFLSLKILLEDKSREKVTLNLKETFMELKQKLAKDLARKELVFNFSGDADLSVFENKAIVQSVLRKIVDNAIKYSYKGGEINFKVEKSESQQSQITVQDFGVGMEKDTLDKLFSLDTVSAKGTENEIGAGLGLVLVKEALVRLDGAIEFSSTLNKGTQVQIKV